MRSFDYTVLIQIACDIKGIINLTVDLHTQLYTKLIPPYIPIFSFDHY